MGGAGGRLRRHPKIIRSRSTGRRQRFQATLASCQREALYQLIVDNCRAFGVGHGSVEEIDSIGIVPATRLAMTRAIEALSPQPNALIIDAVRLPKVNLPQSVFFFADSISLSVAAASIIAKVTRDRLMIELSARYPRL